ncbi:MAG: hypothetical protein ABH863_03135 [Candidatus Micrarchaeota archaeon]
MSRSRPAWNGLFDSVYGFLDLYALVNVTYSHEATTRYADGVLTPKDYKEGLGIVDCFDEIHVKSVNSVTMVKNFISNFKLPPETTPK